MDRPIPYRDEIKIGQQVLAIEKKNYKTGKLSKGIVAEILTNKNYHPRGIKVRFTNGTVARVQKILPPEDMSSITQPQTDTGNQQASLQQNAPSPIPENSVVYSEDPTAHPEVLSEEEIQQRIIRPTTPSSKHHTQNAFVPTTPFPQNEQQESSPSNPIAPRAQEDVIQQASQLEPEQQPQQNTSNFEQTQPTQTPVVNAQPNPDLAQNESVNNTDVTIQPTPVNQQQAPVQYESPQPVANPVQSDVPEVAPQAQTPAQYSKPQVPIQPEETVTTPTVQEDQPVTIYDNAQPSPSQGELEITHFSDKQSE